MMDILPKLWRALSKIGGFYMTDKEIGKKMLLPQSTVRYNRVVAIKMLKRIMEELYES